jgi:hypothetical protein
MIYKLARILIPLATHMPAGLIFEEEVEDLLRHSNRRQGVGLRRGSPPSQTQSQTTNLDDGVQNPLVEDGQDATRRRLGQIKHGVLDPLSVNGVSRERVRTPLRPGCFPCISEGIVDPVGTADGHPGGLPQLQVDVQRTD